MAKLRSRIATSSSLPRVGEDISFVDDNGKKRRGKIVSSYGRVYVIDSEGKRHAKIYDEQHGFGGVK
jgi:hypothetical protein